MQDDEPGSPTPMILVTGAGGFIGGHLVQTLVAAGRPVRCLLRRTPPSHLSGAEIVRGDLVSGAGLRGALEDVSCVIHLAGVTKAIRPAHYHTGNVVATANLVRALGDSSVRLVHVSSLAAAGPSPDGMPLEEDATASPVSLYGRSKLEGERAAAERPGTVIVRPPVVYGPRDTDVFQMLQSVSRGLVLEIAGGERWFSAIYVEDLIRGLLAAACAPAAAGRTYYMAHPAPSTWTEFARVAARLLGTRPRTVRIPYAAARLAGAAAEVAARLRGVPGILSRDKVLEARCIHWTCGTARAARELGFTASTGLEEGLARSIAWYRTAGWLS